MMRNVLQYRMLSGTLIAVVQSIWMNINLFFLPLVMKKEDLCNICKLPNQTIIKVHLVYGLKHSLLTIIQICDKANNITFDSYRWRVISQIRLFLFTSSRSGNIYIMNLNKIHLNDVCLLSNGDETHTHQRVAHIYMEHWKKFARI